jgi:hypothetical protein
MDTMLGLLFLVLALAAMFWLIRSWDAVREQFGTQLQDLFGPQERADAADPGDAPWQTLHDRHMRRLEARRQQRGEPHGRPASTRHHTPTARHH